MALDDIIEGLKTNKLTTLELAGKDFSKQSSSKLLDLYWAILGNKSLQSVMLSQKFVDLVVSIKEGDSRGRKFLLTGIESLLQQVTSFSTNSYTLFWGKEKEASDEAKRRFMKAVKEAPHLEKLSLLNTLFAGEMGGQVLNQAIINHPTLKELDLSGNNLRERGVIALLRGEIKLTKLSLRKNSIRAPFSDSEVLDSEASLLKIVGDIPTLTELDLEENDIPSKIRTEIKRILATREGSDLDQEVPEEEIETAPVSEAETEEIGSSQEELSPKTKINEVGPPEAKRSRSGTEM